jgi:hypothetical protein
MLKDYRECFKVKVLIPVFVFWCAVTLPAKADIIYFKDGMKSVCQEKAWEEDNEIKCEYKGWVISYRKQDVLRIERTIPEKKVSPDNVRADTHTVQNNKSINKMNHSEPTGPVFYDPRRPYKYWISSDSKHKSYNEAIDALAKKYNRPPEWIQANMGDTNDLEQIHQNLSNPCLKPDESFTELSDDNPAGIAFYNPRREFPYWISEDSKHKNYKDAIHALAEKYGQSAEWIQENMGTSNDLNEIHRQLTARSKNDQSAANRLNQGNDLPDN